jgi:hypothetical protein
MSGGLSDDVVAEAAILTAGTLGAWLMVLAVATSVSPGSGVAVVVVVAVVVIVVIVVRDVARMTGSSAGSADSARLRCAEPVAAT